MCQDWGNALGGQRRTNQLCEPEEGPAAEIKGPSWGRSRVGNLDSTPFVMHATVIGSPHQPSFAHPLFVQTHPLGFRCRCA